MTKNKDQQQALENLKALEEAKLISRRDFFTLSSQLGSGVMLLNFLTPDRALAWVATRMRKGKTSSTSNIDVGDIANSLRLRSANLTKTPASAGSLTTWTFSTWIKRNKLGALQTLFGALSGAGATTEVGIYSNDVLYFVWNSSNMISTTAVLRDPSAWYHIVFVWDTTQATATDRIRFYINGVLQTAVVTGGSYPGLNQSSYWSGTYSHYMGSWGASAYTDGYLSRIAFVGGQALTPSSFGQLNTVTNSWITKSQSTVKAVVDAGGTNSFMLDFDNGTSLVTLGYDKSSKGNNWTLNNVSITAGATYDWMLDVPGNNFATMNPIASIATGNAYSMSAGNLIYYQGTCTAAAGIAASMSVTSGKWYYEITQDSKGFVGGDATAPFILLIKEFTNNSFPASAYYYWQGVGNIYNPSGGSFAGSAVSNGDVLMVAIDLDNGKLFLGKNGTWLNSGVPASGTGAIFTDLGTYKTFTPATGNLGGNMSGFQCRHNFGQTAFAYTPPTGFKSLSTKNIATPTITNAKKHFDVSAYTGDGLATKAIAGAPFAPDFVWLKNRNAAADHSLHDSVRGVTKRIRSNQTTAENVEAMQSFDSGGFTVLGAGGVSNVSGNNFISWLWKGGGAAVANSQGSITSQVSANPTAGFSIVSYTGSGANATVGHGLGVAPKMIILKKRADAAASWNVYHADIGNQYFLNLELTVAKQGPDATRWNNTSPSSTVFNLGSVNATNGTGDFIAYCFAEISGYSKIGSYTGNGSADGPFVYCGFRPRWVMIKRTDTVSDWVIVDSARDLYNVEQNVLWPNLANTEGISAQLDVTSNGMKIRAGAGSTINNSSSATYIFIAFAEAPFKYANAR